MAPRPSGGLATQYAPPLDLPFRFLAVAVASLALLAVVYVWHVPLLLGSFAAPHLVAFVHVNTLGVVAATIFGASYQLLPVVLQRPLASVRLAQWSWWCFVPGVVAFVGGFSLGQTPLTAAGGVLLAAAVTLYAIVVVATLATAPQRDAVYWHIGAAVAGLVTAMTLGFLMAIGPSIDVLGPFISRLLPAHAVLMIGAWVTPMITGVAYRLVGMFTLSEDQVRSDWAVAELLLVVLGAWGLAASLLFGLGRDVSAAAAALWLAGVSFFAVQLARLYRRRRRRTFDIHMPFAATAVFFALLAGALALVGLIGRRAPTDPIWVAAAWCGIAGWAETAIQGFLYKIGTFLTWLHRYAPLAGRRRVPKLEELYGRRTALVGWGSWTAGVLCAGFATLAGSASIALVAALSMSLGAGAFLVNAARVGAHWRSVRDPVAELASPSPAVSHAGR